MWRISQSKASLKVLDTAPQEVKKKWTLWLAIVEHDGPEALRRFSGFHDEALKGQWIGHRSSRLNIRYRIIYRVNRDELTVDVIDVTRHDYKK
jgi:addiction module RelE/StbE family toxin